MDKSSEDELHYMESPDGYIEPLEKAYVFSSRTLLELLVGEKDLIGHLRSVKHYFLMDQVPILFRSETDWVLRF